MMMCISFLGFVGRHWNVDEVLNDNVLAMNSNDGEHQFQGICWKALECCTTRFVNSLSTLAVKKFV